MNNFLNLKVGDIVVAYDDYSSHDYNEHIIKIDSVERDKENATPTNPDGITYYGTDFEEEKWGDDYLTVVTEGNFVRMYKEDFYPAKQWFGDLGIKMKVDAFYRLAKEILDMTKDADKYTDEESKMLNKVANVVNTYKNIFGENPEYNAVTKEKLEILLYNAVTILESECGYDFNKLATELGCTPEELLECSGIKS